MCDVLRVTVCLSLYCAVILRELVVTIEYTYMRGVAFLVCSDEHGHNPGLRFLMSSPQA